MREIVTNPQASARGLASYRDQGRHVFVGGQPLADPPSFQGQIKSAAYLDPACLFNVHCTAPRHT
jgi:hypothetical protein